MALIGWQELVLILIILIFLFGATRMRGLAKGLGDSIREFKNATKDQPDEKENTDEVIKKAAEKMGISTEGKDVKQILREMEKKTKQKN